MKKVVFTIGHSSHSIETFLELLHLHQISAICDVRSTPYSRMNPQFNRETLRNSLKKHNIQYVFLGKELGARSDDPICYRQGRVQYAVLARTALFQRGIQRICAGMQQNYQIALMCAERDPLDCHRTVLVAQHLEGFRILHILSDGSLESHSEAAARLIRRFRLNQGDLFFSPEELRKEAFQKQEQKIAFTANT